MEQDLGKLKEFLHLNYLILNSKTKYVCFGVRKHDGLGDDSLQIDCRMKYLDLVLDKNLNW